MQRGTLRNCYELVLNVSVRSRSNWNLEELVFEERGEPEHPEKNYSVLLLANTKNLTHLFFHFGRFSL